MCSDHLAHSKLEFEGVIAVPAGIKFLASGQSSSVVHLYTMSLNTEISELKIEALSATNTGTEARSNGYATYCDSAAFGWKAFSISGGQSILQIWSLHEG